MHEWLRWHPCIKNHTNHQGGRFAKIATGRNQTLNRSLSAQNVAQTRLDTTMSKIKTVGVYTTDTGKFLGAFNSKAKAQEFANSYPKFTEMVFYYHLTIAQVEVLPYAQAYDFENKIKTATNWRKIA